ncbi:hypothetical protein [Sinorhizobium sp. CCBAU 05631]|uniref:hypothetical protein n=1 Tax=Sinorhizobium sp. CCBAU 05631 TaxID=794846 RepID=UPI0004B21BBA|nr:hypothetical protein [Sinorhizobium sp. CCBAU 05631]ASY57324.1 hypothetical protein SS05631_c23940 [Sinorhizobium sp. CCBAU 05631]
MADNEDDLPEQRTGFLARLSAIETIIVAIIAMIALAGLMLIGKGFYMKATAELFDLEGQMANQSLIGTSRSLQPFFESL